MTTYIFVGYGQYHERTIDYLDDIVTDADYEVKGCDFRLYDQLNYLMLF